jgi:hypothetical protein
VRLNGYTLAASVMRVALICSAACLVLAASLVSARQAPASVSSTRGARDITHTRFDLGAGTQTINGTEVVVSNAAAMISGHVTDSASTPISNYSVVVFATDRGKWFPASRFLRLVRSAQDGSFEAAGLPPGEYWVAAVDPIEGNAVSGDWLKPETLEQLSFRAQRVTLTERERFITVLRVIRR